jgi:hypothetical protein
MQSILMLHKCQCAGNFLRLTLLCEIVNVKKGFTYVRKSFKGYFLNGEATKTVWSVKRK